MMHDAVFGGSAGGSENDSLAIFLTRAFPAPVPCALPGPPSSAWEEWGGISHTVYTRYIYSYGKPVTYSPVNSPAQFRDTNGMEGEFRTVGIAFHCRLS